MLRKGEKRKKKNRCVCVNNNRQTDRWVDRWMDNQMDSLNQYQVFGHFKDGDVTQWYQKWYYYY